MSSTPQSPAANSAPPPVIIAFATQKGGMGKTTLSVLVASWLHYNRQVEVAILDVDSSQQSVYNLRLREIETLKKDDTMRERFNEQDVAPYQILTGGPADVPQLLAALSPVQLVFIDLPGNIVEDGYETALGLVDYLLVPMETSEFSVTTGYGYLQAIQQIELLPVDRCRIVWNRYKPSRDGEVADQLEERFARDGFLALKSRVPQRDSYQDPSNRSTLFPVPTRFLRDSGLKDLFVEIEAFSPSLIAHSNA